MLTKREIKNLLKKELNHLKFHFGVKRIGLLGSYSKGTQQDDSEILEFEMPIDLKFVELSDYFENLLGKKVDILTPNRIEFLPL